MTCEHDIIVQMKKDRDACVDEFYCMSARLSKSVDKAHDATQEEALRIKGEQAQSKRQEYIDATLTQTEIDALSEFATSEDPYWPYDKFPDVDPDRLQSKGLIHNEDDPENDCAEWFLLADGRALLKAQGINPL